LLGGRSVTSVAHPNLETQDLEVEVSVFEVDFDWIK